MGRTILPMHFIYDDCWVYVIKFDVIQSKVGTANRSQMACYTTILTYIYLFDERFNLKIWNAKLYSDLDI